MIEKYIPVSSKSWEDLPPHPEFLLCNAVELKLPIAMEMQKFFLVWEIQSFD